MKKILLYLLLSAFIPVSGYSQGFLKKLKQKADKAIGKAIGVEEPEDAAAFDTESDTIAGAPTATDRLPKLRRSSVVWDGEVQPSRANSARALLSELPPLPSVEELVNPTDGTRTAYYNRLTAIDLRVDELDRQEACDDEEMLAMREKLYQEMVGITGLTVEEMKRLDDPNLSQAERARLEEKMKAHVLGGVSVEQIVATAESKEARLQQLLKEAETYEAKEKAGTLTEADRQRAMAIGMEAMAIQQEMMQSMSGVINVSNKSAALAAKLQAENAEVERRLKIFANKMAALRKNEAGVVKSCGEIAAEYEAQLRGIYEKIWAESDEDAIQSLYDQADALMKNYRRRAAKIYLKGLQLRLDNTKKLMPEAEKLYAEMARNEMIPACAQGRAPLNVVVNCIDILHDAYDEFPQPYVSPAKKEEIELLKKGERVLFAESGFAGGFMAGGGDDIVKDFIAGSRLLVYNSADKSYYEVSGGQRRKLSGEGPFDLSVKTKRDPKSYGDIPMRKGARKAVYTRDGALTLHDGTGFYPLAMKRFADRLEFIIHDGYNSGNFYKCTYKL